MINYNLIGIKNFVYSNLEKLLESAKIEERVKERLAELLEERDEQDRNRTIIPYQSALGGQYNPPCYAPDGICTNPFHDCINCPRIFGNGTTITSDGTNLKSINQ